MLKSWLHIAFTNYKKNWLSSIINIIGLSVGLCVFLLVYINWQDEKTYEKWIPNKENTYMIELEVGQNAYNSIVNYPLLIQSKASFPEIENYSVINNWDDSKEKIIAEGRSTFTNPIYVTEDFFKILKYPKIAGSYDNIFVDDHSIAISQEVAQQLFGDRYLQSIGKVIVADGDNSRYIVQAIYQLPNQEERSVFRPGYIVRQPNIASNKDQWTNFSYMGFISVKPGTNIQALEAKLSKMQSHNENINAKKYGWSLDFETKAHLTNIEDIRLDALSTGVDKADKLALQILLALSSLLLVLSCINLINLKIAQSSQRAKEVGVKKVIGSSQRQLITQFLIENFIICLVAYLLAFTCIEFLLPTYNQFLQKDIQLNNANVYFGSALLLLFISLLSGIIPALYLSNFQPINTLKGNFSRSKNGIWLRNSILGLQLIISSFFIICSFIINAQVNYMLAKDLGFKSEYVYQINFNKLNYSAPDIHSRKYELQKSILKNFPGVKEITGSAQTIGNGVNSTSGARYVKDSTKSTGAGIGAIDYNYFEFYKIQLLAGRMLTPKLSSDSTRSIVVNNSLVKNLGWTPQEALGKELTSGMDDRNKRLEIVGVINDFYLAGVDNTIQPVIFFNYNRNWAKNQMTNLQIKLSSDHLEDNIATIKKYWETKVEPGYPFNGEFVDRHFAKTFERYQKQRQLFTAINAIVLVVALLGLFALSSLIIEQKLKDVAIKITLGANEKTIIWDLAKLFIKISSLSIFLSFPFAYYAMNEWLKDFAYRIDMPIWPYIMSLILLVSLSFLVVSIKAHKATRIHLVKYLKYE